MKNEYKFLVDLCNSYVAPLDHNEDFDFRWWIGATGAGYETSKSTFVENIIDLVTIKDKKFPKREFLKQVKCHYRHGSLIDSVYSKQHDKEGKKILKQQKKEDREAEKEKQKLFEMYNYDYFYNNRVNDIV